MSVEPSPLEELAELVASVQAYVEWHASTVLLGFPREQRSPQTNDHRAPQPPPPTPTEPQAPRRAETTPSTAALPEVRSSPSIPIPLEERPPRLERLAAEVERCARCDLHATRARTVFARGNPCAELCFVGARPGSEDEAQGAPFADRAGLLLDRMIEAMGYVRDDVYVCNVIKCRPPADREPKRDELRACFPYVVEQLEIVEPKVIVALGSTAAQALLGTSEPIERIRGKWKLYKGRIPVMPTFDPAYVLMQPASKRDVWADLQETMRILGKTPRPRS